MLERKNYWSIGLHRLAYIIKLVKDRACSKIKKMPSESSQEWNLAFKITEQ